MLFCNNNIFVSLQKLVKFLMITKRIGIIIPCNLYYIYVVMFT